MIEKKISDLLEQRFQEEDLIDCFIVDLKLGINKKLEIFVDSDSGIDFSTCRVISRYLESHLDENLWLGEKYILEVSSPGATRPLTQIRQYNKHIGRKLEIKRKEAPKITGDLTEITEEGIQIYFKERIKEGKKKKTVEQNVFIAFEDIEHSIVKLRFK